MNSPPLDPFVLRFPEELPELTAIREPPTARQASGNSCLRQTVSQSMQASPEIRHPAPFGLHALRQCCRKPLRNEEICADPELMSKIPAFGRVAECLPLRLGPNQLLAGCRRWSPRSANSA